MNSPKRYAPILRSAPPRKRRRGGPRRGTSIDKGYVRFIHEKCGCAICGKPYPDGAHTQNGGMRIKGPDSSRAPLCRVHHQQYDAGRARFEAAHNINMQWVAAATFARYRKSTEAPF